MADYFEFLKSSRFHAAVGVVVLYYLKTRFSLETTIADSLIALLVAHIGIKTVDRASEKIGGAK